MKGGRKQLISSKFVILQGISVQFSSLLKLVKDHQDQYEDNNSLLNKRLAEYSKQGNQHYCSISAKTASLLSGYLARTQPVPSLAHDTNWFGSMPSKISQCHLQLQRERENRTSFFSSVFREASQIYFPCHSNLI